MGHLESGAPLDHHFQKDSHPRPSRQPSFRAPTTATLATTRSTLASRTCGRRRWLPSRRAPRAECPHVEGDEEVMQPPLGTGAMPWSTSSRATRMLISRRLWRRIASPFA